MDLERCLAAVRDHYLAAYRTAIASYRQRFNPAGPEVLLEVDRQAPRVYRYYRMDLASGAIDPPDLTEVNPSTHLEFATMQFNRDGLQIEVSPFVWNGAQFRIAPPISDTGIQAWAIVWLDPDEHAEADSDGLGGYIHSVTVPEVTPESMSLSVDFGSAPVRSVLDLLAVLQEAGATRVRIHSEAVLAS